MKKHGKGQCRVYSGSLYADAAPLRRGSPYCHHHRVRCAGKTRTGARCTVTSSSDHSHADPLRKGELYCAHHLPKPSGEPATSQDAAPPSSPRSDARFSEALGMWDEMSAASESESEDASSAESDAEAERELGPGQWLDESGYVRVGRTVP